jgi:hypothetical protein
MRFEGAEYIGDQDLADNSVPISTSNDDELTYAEWLKLKCANGAVGWLFAEEVKDDPGFSPPNIVKYGLARDQRHLP